MQLRALEWRGFAQLFFVLMCASAAAAQTAGSSSDSAARAAHPNAAGAGTWQPFGPAAVSSQSYGLITGRITALALDPSDSTGNKLYVGTTGGGVWYSQDAGSAASFAPLTDAVAALSGATDASISIGALTVQPGGTGVVLAGTGDTNDSLDSYYGAGILRSADGGTTWILINETVLSPQGNQYSFAGEGFSGFAWSTANPQVVVAAVSQAFRGTLVNAVIPGVSYEGLYYSADSGATWNLATITDGSGNDVQGPGDAFAQPDGNAVTSVVWNPVRKLFFAAVRFHGYYQSGNGVTWTRMTSQPGANLTAQLCPTNTASTGSTTCPIFRGTLAVNPQTGDTFAWTVDAKSQDQGLWQDQCGLKNGSCFAQSVSFSQQWSTAALESNTSLGAATIANGDYNLALAAVPGSSDTLLFAGANDLWKCSLAAGCTWRNTTNAFGCASAQVGAYQHAIAWPATNPLEIFVGNDSGLWRSTDAVGETGAACSASDNTHFANLNGGLGSLSQITSLAQLGTNPNTMLAGIGENGFAGVKTNGAATNWPQVLGGVGGAAAIDYGNSAYWYANNAPGVSIHLCDQTGACTQSAFGQNPIVNNADVGNDGLDMTTPAAFVVDPTDRMQLLIATCRVWRGPANGAGWTAANAVSPILDGNAANLACSGDPIIRSIAALALPGGNEMVYVGMYGALDGGGTLAGHIFGALVKPGSTKMPAWSDLTPDPVTNDNAAMNQFGYDISSIFVDPHDTTGNTIYVTIEGFLNSAQLVRVLYQSTDGGAHWTDITSNLPRSPASSVVVDPQDANTIYVATDAGVFFTRAISSCAAGSCWAAMGTGMPLSPVVGLVTTSISSSSHMLTAATYGRGIWQIPLLTAGEQLTTATVKPTSLVFASQPAGSISSAQTITLTNTGSAALNTAITVSADFTETDNCQSAAIAAGDKCAIQVKFAPSDTGTLAGALTISANVSGGQIALPLSGTGAASKAVSLTPPSLAFGPVEVGTTSSPLSVTATNSGAAAISIGTVVATGPFAIAANACGSSLAASSACEIEVAFSPTQSGPASGTLTMTDGAGTQTVQLSGAGAAAPTDTLSTTSLPLPDTAIGQQSPPSNVMLTDSGDLDLTSISSSITGNFQVSSNCGGALAGHSSCAFSVVFAPQALGTQSGTLTITDALRQQKVNLTGTGILPAAFSIQPPKLTFSSQQVGVASTAQQLTVSNSGGAPMANVSFQVVGQSTTSFAVKSTTCGGKLASGDNCTAQVAFTPAATGGNAATMVVSTSTTGVAAALVPLSGVGLAPPQLSVQPPAIPFGGIVIGLSSAAQPVAISNTGGVGLNDLHLAITGDYSFTAGNCTAVLAAGATCTASITFTPSNGGARSGVFTASSTSNAAKPVTVSLSGTGVPPASIQTSTTAIDFGSISAGQVSAAKTLIISDQGTASLKGLTLTINGPFELQQNQCGTSLVPSGSCSTQIVFDPIAAGPQTGTLTVASTTQYAAPVTVALTGTGLPAPVLVVSPMQLTFGSVPLNGSSTPLSFSISDPGGAPVAGLALNISGDFALAHSTCGTTLASGSNCGAQVTFTPTGTGNRSGLLTLSGTSVGLAPVKVQLSGIGQGPGALSASSSNLAFGDVTVGQISGGQTATITNTGQNEADGIAIAATGDYAIQKNTCGAVLAGGVSCTVQIAFSPTATGDRPGTLTASSTTSGVGSAVIVLDGTGVPAGYVTASPTSLTFPAVPVGSTSAAMTVTLTDPGAASVSGLAAQTTGDFSATVCAATLVGGAGCTMSVFFKPTGAGVRAGQLTITTTAAGAPPAIVSLTGTGTVPPSIVLNPTSLKFPATPAGGVSAAQTITVSNPGSSPLDTPSMTVAGDFQIVANGCTSSIASNGSCNVQIEFAPSEAGGRTGTLTVSSATPGVQPAVATLSGSGLTPGAIGVSPSSIVFGVVLVGQTSAPKSVTITNTGGSSLDSISIAASAQFTLITNGCNSSLAAGASCTAAVAFAPIAQGPVTGGLTITSPSVPTPASVALSGTGGAPPGLSVEPGVVNFPTVGVGQASAPVTITISNTGTDAALTGLTLKAAAGFQLVDNQCESSLGAGKSCTAGIEFVPGAAGAAAGELSVSATGVPGASVPLAGRGFDFKVVLQGGSSQTVASGQSANFTLSLEPLGGAQGQFTFECSSVPPNALCLFNPPAETVSANATGTVTVQIATGQSLGSGAGSATASRPAGPAPRISGPLGLRALPAVLGLVLIPFAMRRRRRVLLFAALLAVLACGVTSCLSASGGGTNGQQNHGGPGSTPPATYSIPVTSISNGVQHQVTLSLTVD